MSTEKKGKERVPITAEIKVPEGVTIEINGTDINTKGSLGSNTRKFNDSLLHVSKSGNMILIDITKEKGLMSDAAKAQAAFRKELENDMRGVNQNYERKMRVVFAHFPINVEVRNSMVYINNLIGERVPRISKIAGNTKVEVNGQNVRVYGTSLDDVSQTAANIRQICKIRNKDSRVFQDGVYYEID